MGATNSTAHPYTLTTPLGRLTGIEQRDPQTNTPILRRYTRIPYALPPVGPLRWRRPQPLPRDFTFDDTSSHPHRPGDHTRFGPVCPQPKYNTGAAKVDAADEVGHEASEDCLFVNIWTPAQPPPEGSSGWPVQFHIHGGWLQVGDANQSNDHDPFDLFSRTDTPRVIVAVTYRLNILGFLAGADLASVGGAEGDGFAGNYGLWDQRAALEWTYDHVGMFGGDEARITVGGLSAGAHSSILQLYHDCCLPVEKRVIRQAYFWSNAIGVQHYPVTSPVLTQQFTSLCEAVGIRDPLNVSAAEKVERLRRVPVDELIGAIARLEQHTFRASTDGEVERGGFLPPDLVRSMHDGTFADRLARNGVRVMLGEVHDEGQLYKLVNPPASRDDLSRQLLNYYPSRVVAKLTDPKFLYGLPLSNSEEEDHTTKEQWADIFARIVADMQVHVSIRGLAHSLLTPSSTSSDLKVLPPSSVLRYHIAWRAKSLDKWLKPEVGVCHAADTPIWWYSGCKAGYTDADKEAVTEFLKPFGEFLRGEKVDGWYGGTDNGREGAERKMRVLEKDGTISSGVVDEKWDRALQIWKAVWGVQQGLAP